MKNNGNKPDHWFKEINPNVIAEHEDNNDNPIYYIKRWGTVILKFKEYKFVHTYRFNKKRHLKSFNDHIAEVMMDKPPQDETNKYSDISNPGQNNFEQLAKRARCNFNSLSKKEQHKYRWAHLKHIKPYKKHRKLEIFGKAEIKNQLISVILINENYLLKKEYFEEIDVHIYESNKCKSGEFIGYIENNTSECGLFATIYVKEGILAEIEQDIEQQGGNIPLELIVEAFLFEHPYFGMRMMVSDTVSSIFLNSITLGTKPKFIPAEKDSTTSSKNEEQIQFPAPDDVFREKSYRIISKLDSSLQQIKMALWALVAVLLFSLIL